LSLHQFRMSSRWLFSIEVCSVSTPQPSMETATTARPGTSVRRPWLRDSDLAAPAAFCQRR